MNGLRNLLPNAWYVAMREYRGRVASRSFLIGTVILAAVAFAAAEAPVLVDALVSSSQTTLVVVDRTDTPADAPAILSSDLNFNVAADPSARPMFKVDWRTGDQAAAAQQDLQNGRYDALLTIDRAANGLLLFTLKTDLPTDGTPVKLIVAATQKVGLEDQLVRAGQPEGSANQVYPIVVQSNSDRSSDRTNSLAHDISTNLMSTGLIVLIFMAIITYGTWVAMSVAEEKGSRVMELMLNAATPLQMLAGKVIGNGAAGITQYGVVLTAAIAGVLLQGKVHAAITGTSSGSSAFAGLTPSMVAGFAVLFVLGFAFYSLLYAGLGSLVSRQEDVQSATSPLMMIIMAGYFVSIFALNAINETWVKLLSFVPFFSPYLMLARISMGDVAMLEVALSVLLLIAATAVALVVAARIYSAGVLLYGQRVGLRAIWKASRVAR